MTFRRSEPCEFVEEMEIYGIPQALCRFRVYYETKKRPVLRPNYTKRYRDQ